MPRWVREPLVQFAFLGILLFLVYSAVAPRPRSAAVSQRIEIVPGDVDALALGFERQWRRPPTAAEMRGLLEDLVHEEVLCREAVAMGLDRDDPVIRRRLAEKFRFLTEDLMASHAPSTVELEAFFASHRDRYATRPRFTFDQRYFSEARRGDRARPDAERALASLRAGREPDADPFLLQEEFTDMTPEEVGRSMGAAFADSIAPLPVGAWSGPVRSSYGWHLVRLQRRVPGHPPEFAKVRDQVERDWAEAQRKRMNDEVYHRLRARYDVVVLPRPTGEAQASSLTAPNSKPR